MPETPTSAAIAIDPTPMASAVSRRNAGGLPKPASSSKTARDSRTRARPKVSKRINQRSTVSKTGSPRRRLPADGRDERDDAERTPLAREGMRGFTPVRAMYS
jgi:hypothetical protein